MRDHGQVLCLCPDLLGQHCMLGSWVSRGVALFSCSVHVHVSFVIVLSVQHYLSGLCILLCSANFQFASVAVCCYWALSTRGLGQLKFDIGFY